MNIKYYTFLSLVFLCGCASKVWVKNGASQMDFANDKQFCTLYATQLNPQKDWSWIGENSNI